MHTQKDEMIKFLHLSVYLFVDTEILLVCGLCAPESSNLMYISTGILFFRFFFFFGVGSRASED